MNLNYISLHLYPYEPPKDAGRHHLILSTDPDFFLNYIRKFRKIYANYFLEPLPIYVTYLQNETAPCPWTNDSAFMAPFLFKTYTELYRDVANIAYSAFSDIIYKITAIILIFPEEMVLLLSTASKNLHILPYSCCPKRQTGSFTITRTLLLLPWTKIHARYLCTTMSITRQPTA